MVSRHSKAEGKDVVRCVHGILLCETGRVVVARLLESGPNDYYDREKGEGQTKGGGG